MTARNSTRKPWNLEEDATLLQLVCANGAIGCWPKISLSMEFRTGKQCRERYINHLDPDMKKTAWSVEENNVIRDMFPTFGTKWSQYITALPGRSDNAIKNRYHMISRNNFEYCSNSVVILSLKRPQSEISRDEIDAADTDEESMVDERQKRLRTLQLARMEIEREILELEKECASETRKVPCSPESPSNSDIFTEFTQEPIGEIDGEFAFDFDWMETDFSSLSDDRNC